MWPTDREKEQEKHIFYYSKTPISLSLKFIPQIVSDNIDILYVSIWCILKKKKKSMFVQFYIHHSLGMLWITVKKPVSCWLIRAQEPKSQCNNLFSSLLFLCLAFHFSLRLLQLHVHDQYVQYSCNCFILSLSHFPCTITYLGQKLLLYLYAYILYCTCKFQRVSP